MIKRGILSCIIGIILVLVYAEHDTWVHAQLHRACKQFLSNSFSCSVDFERMECSLITPSITFYTMSAVASDGASWSWKADRCTLQSAWKHVWERGCFLCALLFDSCTMQTVCLPQSCALFEHCSFIMQMEPHLPMVLETATWNHVHSIATDSEHDACILVDWSGSVRQNEAETSGVVQVAHVRINHHKATYIADGTGSLSYLQRASSDDKYSELRTDGVLHLPFLRDRLCALHGIWRNGSGRFSLRNSNGVFSLDPFIITQKNNQMQCTTSGHIPVDALWQLVYGISHDVPVSGNCAYSLTASLGEQASVEGCVTIEQLQHHETVLASSAQLVGRWCDHIWRGNFSLLRPPLCGGMQGTYEFHDDDTTAYITCVNNGIMHMPGGYGWAIMPRDLFCALSRDENGAFHASYQAHASEIHTQSMHDFSGFLDVRNNFFVGRGSFDKGFYMFDGRCNHHFLLDNAAYYDEQGQRGIHVCGALRDEIHTAHIAMRFAWLRGLLRSVWNYDLLGEGVCHVDVTHAHNKISADITMNDAHMRIPGVNNFMHEASAHVSYDMLAQCGTLDACNVRMHTGRISCEHATFGYDNATNSLAYVQLPFVMHHCLLHPHNDLYATVSGHGCAHYTMQEGYALEGHCFLDRAYLKESPFSAHLLKQMEVHPFEQSAQLNKLDSRITLAIESKEPIRIETSHLHARALVDLQLKGTAREPALLGSLKIVSGDLLFPYRSLAIVGGGMQFEPTTMYDPQIQLIAKDKVRSYMVGLHVTGSLQHPEIILESWPVLADEKIASLLLTGSEHEGLNIMMPAAITQRINQMIFRNEFSTSSLYRGTPLHIHVVPSFTNQTARGGLRAALEIDIGDRWHALIQKNFSLSEDTRVEIEYQATDDITMRAIRDERRDISAECEVRWKF